MSSPASTWSAYVRTSVVDVCGSRVVVTPHARFARYFHTAVSWMPHVGQGWAWISISPGMMVLPATSMTRARPGAGHVAATHAMRLSVTTRSPFSISSSPFIETMRAPRNTTDPRGTSRGTRIVTSTRSPSYAGSLARESTRAFPTESGFSLVACLSEAARIESARALALASESPRAGLYRKKLRPTDQDTVIPSGAQPMKSPPTRVSRWTGNDAAVVSATLIAGGVAPTTGSVTRYTLLLEVASTRP